MKRETRFLKTAVIFIGLPILAVCVIVLPMIAREAAASSSHMAAVLYGIVAGMYLSAIPFFMALFQAFTLLNLIDRNDAFSDLGVKALKKITYAAATISILYIAMMPLFYTVGEVEDAPGVILIGMLFAFAPMVVAVFAAVLQKLLQNAIEIKSDNELTI
ncbi:DUF2975 domain-containing protein [Anoxynatronum sibiricum]|uniref:DUF2975 domain-containing protein n=1 Tax=Anoxynatronum sibiricum TaxID=210623 RepID=A0ABU9VT59_9CLOT